MVHSTIFHVNDRTAFSIDGPPPFSPEWNNLRVVQYNPEDDFEVHYHLADVPPELVAEFQILIKRTDEVIEALLARSRWDRLSASREVVMKGREAFST